MSQIRTIDHIEGKAIPLRGDNIDTDRIIPARYLKAVTFDGLGNHVFEDDKVSMPDHPFCNPNYESAKVLLANSNFGSGSSREHAPQALKRWGIDACVAESFSEIFRGNSLAIGLPCFTANQVELEFVMSFVENAPDTKIVVSTSDLRLWINAKTIELTMPDGMRDALLKGYWDATGMLLEHFKEVHATAKRLPYMNPF